jgi:hypothetical protein
MLSFIFDTNPINILITIDNNMYDYIVNHCKTIAK